MPTYVGLRLLLNQLDRSILGSYLNGFLFRKIPTRQATRYRNFFQFKSQKPSGEVKFREFFAASPSCALSEAFTLQLLSKIPSLRNRRNVYSYRWPSHDRMGRCFSYFFSGYRDRRNKVTELLHANNEYVVAVYDIRQFYPSINKDLVAKRLESHIDQLGDKGVASFVKATCDQIMATLPKGIPIGPAPSHVFGNIAMERVDSRMTRALGDRYLRYVDDIFLVVLPNELKQVERRLRDLIHSEGLVLHDEKYDVVDREQWLRSIPTDREEELSDRFDSFIQRIRLFLWRKPDSFQALRDRFMEFGNSIPLTRFFLDAQYSRFQRFMNNIIRRTTSLQQLLQLFSETEHTLLAEAAKLREEFQHQAEQMAKADLPERGMARRTIVQRLRYAFNRLLYLISLDEFPSLLSLAPDIDELYEYRSLVKALVERQVGHIINTPGPAVSTFASVCQQHEDIQLSTYDKKLLNGKGAIDSLCVLTMFGIAEPPNLWLKTLSKHDSELVKFCMLSIPDQRDLDDHSYEDEVRSLQVGEKVDRMKNIFNTRFSDLEAMNLDGLLLSKYGYA